EDLTVIDVAVNNIETLRELRSLENIRYMEPASYSFDDDNENLKATKGAGCGVFNHNIHANDVTYVSPGAWVSWSHVRHNVVKAWKYSKGEGITVGLIDTGMSEHQKLMGSQFSNQYSPNRYIVKKGVYAGSVNPWSNNYDGDYDLCGHGTAMGSIIAAPMNNKKMPAGVANQCNLIAYRACADVVLNYYQERKGVAKALTQLGKNKDVKIISMSIGYPYKIDRVADAVKFAHKKGKMIIAAGGTSTTFTNWYGVIFPASMKETVAITGIKDNEYKLCNICHDGKKIDFAIRMQRSTDISRGVVCLGLNANHRRYIGGSSAATATTAGIAALVWARHPNWSREQVLNKLIQSAEFYPNKDHRFGYGCIDALKAVK
ncbi:MAG: S8 family serine peptidase, partial [Bacteroidales bacterium]|nr:S8 family serine peptidase [Bacteroidales bacterium]